MAGLVVWRWIDQAKLAALTKPATTAGPRARLRPVAPTFDPPPESSRADATLPGTSPPARAVPAASSGEPIEIGIAYGTEKRNWLEWAVKEFAATDEGRRIHVNLIPMGSVEGARAVIDGDKHIHVWSPASKLYREAFVRDWGAKYTGNPIFKEESLAITPMVFVMWKSRYNAFAAKSAVSLKSIGYALNATTGWAAIAKKPEWGLFKFGLTDPNQSNSGLATLILMAYEFHNKTSGLLGDEVRSPAFLDYLKGLERGMTSTSNSTGNLMQEMIVKGPSSFDALMVYEAVAIDFLKNAEGRWGDLRVIYPKYNLWNDNPYYVLSTPWTSIAHQNAAVTFLEYLMTEPLQTRALHHGFRPGNAAVSIKGLDSPFVRYQKYGLSIEIPSVCDTPSVEVIENLQQSWARFAVPH